MTKIATTAEKRNLPTPSAKPLAAAQQIRPTAIHTYPDTVVVWITRPLTEFEAARLDQLCGTVRPPLNRPTRFGGILFRQRLILHQPSPAALDMILRRGGPTHLTAVDPALDWTFATRDELDRAEYFLDRHQLRKRARKPSNRCEETRYSCGRAYASGKPIPIVFGRYGDESSRITGAPRCLHQEARINGAATLARFGIHTLSDLPTFDMRRFWSENLTAYAVNHGRLGLMFRNLENHTHYKTPTQNDIERGERLSRGLSVEHLLLLFRQNRFRINRCLDPIPLTHLLPNAPSTPYYDKWYDKWYLPAL